MIYQVREVPKRDIDFLILEVHYAKRWPSVSYAYGLYRGEELVGAVTYGSPPTSPQRSGVAGKEFAKDVLELNRLVLRDNLKNEASMLVSRSLKLLPKGKIVISYADPSEGHRGVIYQASNSTYHGLTEKRTDWKIEGMEHLHNQTIVDEFRGLPNRAQLVREKYGDRFKLVDRPRKHRYIYIVGDKNYKKSVPIKYPIKPYPKVK